MTQKDVFNAADLFGAIVDTMGTSVRQPFTARLGYIDENGIKYTAVPADKTDIPGMLYFHEAPGEAPFVGQAMNTGIAPLDEKYMIYGMPVRVREVERHHFVIDGLDSVYAAQYIGTATLDPPQNPTRLETFLPGQLDQTDPASMGVRIMGAPYRDSDGTFIYLETVTTADITTLTDTSLAAISLPTGDLKAKIVLVQRTVGNSIEFKQGDLYDRTMPFLTAYSYDQSTTSVSIFPSPDTTRFMVGYIRLTSTTVKLERDKDIWTLQEVFSKGGGGTGTGDDLLSWLGIFS